MTKYTAKAGGKECTTTALSCTISGLDPGGKYSVQVFAANEVGYGAGSAELAAATLPPATAPGPPRSVKVTRKSDGFVVSWKPPKSNGGAPITIYTAKAGGEQECSTKKLTCRIRNLPSGYSYQVEVFAANEVGYGKPAESGWVDLPAPKPEKCKPIDSGYWGSINQSPQDYVGKCIVVWLNITQADDQLGPDSVRVDVNDHNTFEDFGPGNGGFFSGDNAILDSDGSSVSGYRTGTVLKATVTVAGSTTYTTLLGAEVTVPHLYLESAEWLGSTER